MLTSKSLGSFNIEYSKKIKESLVSDQTLQNEIKYIEDIFKTLHHDKFNSLIQYMNVGYHRYLVMGKHKKLFVGFSEEGKFSNQNEDKNMTDSLKLYALKGVFVCLKFFPITVLVYTAYQILKK